jgi:acyl-coenzyme A thioesterase PaaI-like protein
VSDTEQHGHEPPPTPQAILDARERAAAALRRLGHAVVGHECDPALLEQVAVRADRIAGEVELGTPRSRPIADLKRRLWERPPPDGGAMSHFDECVVSGRANPMGIAIEVRREADEAVADVTLGPAFEGAPKRAHGGTVAAIFDDVMGYVLILHRTPAYTGRLTVHYRAPVPMGQPLTFRARLEHRDGRKLTIVAQAHAGDELLCEAEGLFIAIPPERLGISPDALPADPT